MARRGPDASVVRSFGQCALAHERLAIIDLAGGQQPLLSEDGRVAVIVNGEIYNHLALRAQLIACGHQFRTNADSEVVVHGYEEYGVGVFERLHGMFAVAIWDARNRSLVLARDPLGKKPLAFTWLDSRTFAFASDVRAFHQHPQFRDALRPAGLAEYLARRCVSDPGSIYDSVRKVPAGEWLKIDVDGHASSGVHWRFPAAEPPIAYDPAREADLCDELRHIVRTSVERRLMSDVPVGILLSGGIDSAIVAYEAAQLRHGIDTFSLGFVGKRDELGAARATAAALKTRHHESRIEADPRFAITAAEGAYDEPFADSSSVASLRLCAEAKMHVGVVLNGDGGDEAFAGYPRMRMMAGLGNGPISRAGLIRANVVATLGPHRPRIAAKELLRIQSILRRHATPLEQWNASHWIFSPDEIERMTGIRNSDAVGGDYDFQAAEMDDYRGYLCSDLLVKMDRASMHCGLETRSPLLDVELIRFARRLAPEWKVQGGAGKYLLRAAYAGRVPDHVWKLPKRGFASPTRAWLGGALREEVQRLASDRRQPIYQYLDHEQVRRVTDAFSGFHKKIWTLLVLNRWLQGEAARQRRGERPESAASAAALTMERLESP